MKKVFVLFQWFVVTLIVVGYAWYLLRPKPEPEREPEAWHSWKGFYAVSYEGITRDEDPRYVSPGRLNEQLGALHGAGFKTITPGDVLRFYREGTPLPEKAVLLIFEGGRKDSLIRSTPILQHFGYSAVMAVPTFVTDEWGHHQVKEGDIGKIAGMDHWTLASMGHDANKTIAIDESRLEGHFLSNRKWHKGRRETEEEFARRVTEDYRTAAELLTTGGAPPLLYLYPFADPGTGRLADPMAAQLNRQVVRDYHQLAITGSGDPFNGLRDNPYHLTRLRARGDWTGEDLLAEIERFSPNLTSVDYISTGERWFAEGPVAEREGGVRIAPDGRVLLRGSSDWMDARIRFSWQLRGDGLACLYLRFAGPHAYIRLTSSAEGMRIQERLYNQMHTVAWHPYTEGPTNRHTVEVRIKRNRLWVSCDGTAVIDPAPVSRTVDHGKIQFIHEDEGAVTLYDFEAEALPPLYLVGPALLELPDDVRRRVTYWVPPWFGMEERPEFDLSRSRRDAVLAAAAEGIAAIPRINPAGELDLQQVEAVMSELRAVRDDPLMGALIDSIAVSGYHPKLIEACRAEAVQIVSIISPETALSIAESPPDPAPGILLITEGPQQREALEALMYHIPAHHLVAEGLRLADRPYGVAGAMRSEALRSAKREAE